MIRRFRRLVLLVPLLALAACSVNPATGKQSFTAFMSREDELRIGAEEHPKLIKEFGGAYGDAKLRAYMRRIGLKLARVSDDPSLPYTFTILDDDRVNAFALPGGYVHVTRGILALAENEAEIAGVLAHEIGHVTAHHTAERYSTTMATNLGLMVLGVIGSSAGLPPGVGRLAGFGAQAALAGYSREQELDADMLAVRYLTRAGYSPDAMTSFFAKMLAHSELETAMAGEQNGGANPDIMATHPRTAKRIQQAIDLARATPVAEPRLGRDEYLAEIDGMIFGDDPEQGIRKGRLFVHPELGIQFKVPPGFQMFNSPRRLVARGPKQSTIVFDMAGKKATREARSMTAYVGRVWGADLTLEGLERIDVNGMEVATGRARVSGRGGPLDVRLLAIRGGPEQIFRFTFVSPPEVTQELGIEFRRTTYSFRRLSPAEAAAIRPLRIKVVSVEPGDTPESLAARMPLGKFSLRWFETLNGLRRGQGLRPGTKVKIVGE